ncbi:2717_t:CDS:2, partial [Dentiscutata heterogama]
VANLNAVCRIGTGNQIGGLNTAGKFRNAYATEIGRIGAGVTTDWSIAGSEPTNNMVVASNMASGFPAITIASGIKLGQLIFLLRTAYTTVEYLKQIAVFGQLMQGNMDIEEFSAKIKKFNNMQVNITEALAKVKKFTLSQKSVPSSFLIFLTANPYADTNKLEMTKTKIMDLIKTTMVFSESQMAQQNTDLWSTIKSFQETMS